MENDKLKNQEQCAIPVVSTRTYLFSGWYAGAKFEIRIKANDRETAIAYFETDYPKHQWYQTEEL